MNIQTDRIVREAERREITGLSRTRWWEMEGAGEVPQRILIGSNAVGWRLSELMDWIDSRPRGVCHPPKSNDASTTGVAS